ncbi:MAG: class I SAM-dependent methyltransferase [Calditrichaeota bacterium]|nr:class I SAM-dependent methyltransferase [Calditrichota bacterium]MCB9366333.1 class I SAM-dependent methyltransferase [Calditrichota bacterium]
MNFREWPRLICVECGQGDVQAGTTACRHCGKSYPIHTQTGIPVAISSRSPLNEAEVLAHHVESAALDLNVAHSHWKTGTLRTLLDQTPGKKVLSYGSGDGGDRAMLEAMGYDLVCFDIYPGPYTDIVCDGHELPFADEQFDLVVSTAVFEHLYNPFQAAREIARVLKPGGALIGSAAFLEPYHANSYFHMSHLGLTEIFSRAGLQKIEIHPGWSFVESLNGRFWLWNRARPIAMLTRPLRRLRYRLGMGMWKIAYALKGKDVPAQIRLGFCGSLIFKVVKPGV